MKRFIQFSIVGLLSFLLVSCSLNKQESTSSLNISLPSKEKLKAAYHQSKGINSQSTEPESGFVVSRVIINIRGEGMSGILSRCWTTESNIECGSLSGQASLIIPELPIGQKLIQLVIVADEELSNGERGDRFLIYYGDKDQKLEPGNVRSLITLKLFSSEDGNAVIKGRYLGTGGKGPTGKLDAYIVPPTGRPPMKITETEIFDGWFTGFSLYEKSFRYVHRDSGTVIIAENSLVPGATNSFVTTATTKERVIVEIPENWHQEQDDVGGTFFERNSPERGVLGYFGPGSAGKKVCILDFDESAPGDFDDLYADNQGLSKINWDPTSTSPSSTTVGRPFGGELASVDGGTVCNETDVYSKALVIGKEMIEEDLHSIGLFMGPFRPIDIDEGDLLEGTPAADGTSVQLQWKYLPGIFDGPSPIEGLRAYVVEGITDMDEFSRQFDGGDGLPCEHSKALSYGFKLMGETSGGQESLTITGLNMQAPDDTALMLCPFRGTENFNFGLSNFKGPGNNKGDDYGNDPPRDLVLSFNNGSGNPDDYRFGFLDDGSFVNLAKDTITVSSGSLNSSWFLGLAAKEADRNRFDLLEPSHIESLEFSIDGGSYSNVDINTVASKPAPFGSTVAAIRGDQLDVESAGAFSGDVNGDTSLRVRFTVTQDYADNQNISDRTFESGNLNFIGRTLCDTTGTSVVLHNTNTDETDFTSILNAGETTLSDKVYQQGLYWAGGSCVSNRVIAPVTTVSYSGQSCFDDARDYRGADQDLSVRLDWTDPLGRYCDLNGDSITFNSIYFDGVSIDSTYNFGSGDVLNHSQAVSYFAPYLSDDLGIAADKSILLETAHLGPGVQVAWRTHQVNSDFRMIDGANDPSADKWNAPADMWDSPTSNQNLAGLFNKISVVPSSDSGAKLHSLRDAGDVHPDFEFRVQVKDTDQVFFRTSNKFFEGGSPLFLGYSQTNPNELNLWHWGNGLVQYDSYDGESLANITPGGPIPLPNNASLRESGHVASFKPVNGDDNETIVLTAGDRMMFGMRDSNGVGDFTWSNQVLFEHSDTTPMIVMGLQVLNSGSQDDLFVLVRKSDDSEMYLIKFNPSSLPYYDGSDWVNYPGGGSIDEAAFGATYGTLGGNLISAGRFNSPGEVYGFKKCSGGEIGAIAGKDLDGGGSNFLHTWVFDASGSDRTLVGGSASFSANHNDFSCNSWAVTAEMILLTYVHGADTGPNTPQLNIWNDNSSAIPCGSNANGAHVRQPWSGLINSADQAGGVIIRRDKTLNASFDIIAIAANGTDTVVRNRPMTTCGTNPTQGSPIIHGNLPVTKSNNTIFGFSLIEEYFSGNELYSGIGQRVFILGENSQIYQTNFQYPAP